MDALLNIVIIVISFSLIIWGGDKFVDSCIYYASKFKIPTPIVGATITSIGTTLPELLVTIFSGTHGASGVALGNALGSIIFNTCIIGGILIFCLNVKKKSESSTPAFLLVFSVVIVSIMCFNQVLEIYECLILLALFAVFVFLNFMNAKKQMAHPKSADTITSKKIKLPLLFLILSALAIGTGAHFAVESATALAKLAGLSDTFIGLTIVSLGTSLPELITTLSAIRKKEAGLGLGNIIGSNIINCTLLCALSGLFAGSLIISSQTLAIGIPFAMISVLILLIPYIKGKTSHKNQSIILFTLFAIYYALLILS